MSARFAVIGHPIAHSLSPSIHQVFAKQTGVALTYETMDAPIEAFEAVVANFFEHGGFGLNVTLPFKARAYGLATHKSKRCEMAQSANTLWLSQGQLQADTTDGVGLITDLKRMVPLKGQSMLILGAGGAVSAILPELLQTRPSRIVLMNRTLANAEALASRFSNVECLPWGACDRPFDVVINGTSASTVGHALQWPSGCAHPQTFAYDLAYNVRHATPFTAWAVAQSLRAQDGLGMLVYQAAASFCIWHGVRPDAEAVLKQFGR